MEKFDTAGGKSATKNGSTTTSSASPLSRKTKKTPKFANF